jgi:hypothetical protein
MALATGFWSFKTFAAAIELDLFTQVSRVGAATVEDLGAMLGLQQRPADLLLAACASLGLLDKDADRYRNSPLAEEFLVSDRPYYFGGFVRYLDQREYPAWHRVVEALRTNRPLTWDPDRQDSMFSAEDPVVMELFWEAMHSISIFTARALAEAYDFTGHSRLLDVGGGSGAYPIELCGRYPDLAATVLDLPHVCEIAAGKVTAAGLDKRIDIVCGDFLAPAPLPGGYDVFILSSILHDWDERTGRDLLAKCHAALPERGVVLICELVLNPERTGPPAAALMGMNMLVELVGGKNYSETEYTNWLIAAGFTSIRVLPLIAAGANAVIIAAKE